MTARNWQLKVPTGGYPEGMTDALSSFIERNDPSDLTGKQLSFHQFAALCGRAEADRDIVSCANFLVSSGIFEVIYLFEDDDGGLSEVFSPADLIEARSEGCLAHPRTGEEILDFEARLYPLLVFSGPHNDAPSNGAK